MKERTRKRKASKKLAPRVDLAGMRDYFAHQPDVVLAYLFGSVARGQGDHFSDVDVAVLFVEFIGAERRSELCIEQSFGLQKFADRQVQVVALNTASPVLKFQVLAEGKMLFARSEIERIEFHVRSVKVYHDTQSLRDFNHAILRAELERKLHGQHSSRA